MLECDDQQRFRQSDDHSRDMECVCLLVVASIQTFQLLWRKFEDHHFL